MGLTYEQAWYGSGGKITPSQWSAQSSPAPKTASGSSRSYSGGSSSPSKTAWQIRLEQLAKDPNALRDEINRTTGILTTKPGQFTSDWLSKLSGVAKQVNQGGPSIANYGAYQPTVTPATTPTVAPVTPNTDLNSLISKLSSGYSYTPPSEDELLRQAKQYGELQTSPLLEAIRSRMANAQTQYGTQRAATEAAYSTLPQQTERYLKMAEEQAMARAIRQGGGRGGELNWFTQKMQEPVLLNAQQQEAEKTAKLAAIAEQLASTQTGIEGERQNTVARQGQLEAARLAELRAAVQQAQLQQQGINWDTVLKIAEMVSGY